MMTVRKLRTAVVTGATDGLGRATALMLAANGYRVFGGGRNAGRLASLQGEASQRKLALTALEMDVTSDDSVGRAIRDDSECCRDHRHSGEQRRDRVRRADGGNFAGGPAPAV
jgi:NADP-dependent 3-hydroxy acid dehydrogenase YdfG